MTKITRNILVMLFFISLVFGTAISLAAPDPAYVNKIKQQAPLHVEADVLRDAFVKDISDEIGIPAHSRSVDLGIVTIHKKPSDMQLEPGNTLQVRYTYLPEWLEMSGPARVDLRKGDRIEIWLTEKDGVWRPAYSGETIKFISKTKLRNEHIREPLFHKLFQVTKMDIKSVLLFSFAALAVTVIIIRDLLHHRIKNQC